VGHPGLEPVPHQAGELQLASSRRVYRAPHLGRCRAGRLGVCVHLMSFGGDLVRVWGSIVLHVLIGWMVLQGSFFGFVVVRTRCCAYS
jgi:hypothetical protein